MFIWAPVYCCTHLAEPQPPPPHPPAFGSYTRALLVSKIDDISLWPPVCDCLRPPLFPGLFSLGWAVTCFFFFIPYLTNYWSPEMEFLDINFKKDSSHLLHAIHSSFYWRILKKTKLFFGFKNTYKKNPWSKKTWVYSWIPFCRTEKER